MKFSGEELVATLKVAQAMVMADGHVDENELKVMSIELVRFGVPKEHLEKLLQKATVIEWSDALAILAQLDDERKKYVSSYLGTIMVSDGDIDEKEVALWKLISTMCDFPSMTIAEAIDNMENL